MISPSEGLEAAVLHSMQCSLSKSPQCPVLMFLPKSSAVVHLLLPPLIILVKRHILVSISAFPMSQF